MSNQLSGIEKFELLNSISQKVSIDSEPQTIAETIRQVFAEVLGVMSFESIVKQWLALVERQLAPGTWENSDRRLELQAAILN